MSPVKSAKHALASNSQVKQQHKQEDSEKKADAMKKVYIHRNSCLTDMMQVNHFRSLYNICLAACFFVFVYMVAFYLAEPPKFWKDLNRIEGAATKFPYFVMFWLLFHLIAFAFFEGFKLWVVVRNKMNPKAADHFFLLLYITSLVFTFVVPAHYMLKIKLLSLFGFIASVEQVRLHMKIHSFVREKAPCVMQYKPEKDGRQQEALCPTRKQYLYYLFAPVLIYRDVYPRTEDRRWANVFSNLYKFCLCVFLIFCILMRFNADVFENAGLQPFTKKEALLISAGSMAFGIILKWLSLYSVLHCWLNAFAELLRFGDREFYQDWWNSTNLSQYFRKWNIVVHDWLHCYIYKELQRMGCGTFLSRAVVLVISSLFHEYMLFLSFQLFYPVFFVLYMTGGVLLVQLTKQRPAQNCNTFLWVNLLINSNVLILLWSLEFYARVNCPKTETYTDFFIPRSWDPSCRIIA